MPRPPQHVPPHSLGGCIRAARKRKHLSLAEVAGKTYSTSLLSQIERNRIDPSPGSLRFLAERLELSFDELMELAQQQKMAESAMSQYDYYENLRAEASQALTNKHINTALDMLKKINLSLIPSPVRWRLAALRGHCYFALRNFLAAEQDFLYALTEEPKVVPADQQLELITLHLHLAATLRELEQPEAASQEFEHTLKMIDGNTPIQYAAEAHWGLSLILFERAVKMQCAQDKEELLSLAYEHAQTAYILYRSSGEHVRAALLACLIGLIEQQAGQLDQAHQQLQKLLLEEQPLLEQLIRTPTTSQKQVQEQANVVSAAACSLAGVELERKNYEAAQSYVQQAYEAGKLSYTLREAEALMILGRILEEQKLTDPAAEAAFREAVAKLEPTHHIAARIRAHNLLGRYLLKRGKTEEGEKELDQALQLSHLASAFTSSTIPAENEAEQEHHLMEY